MILIDKPYVSDFLTKTLKENHIQIIATNEAKELIDDSSLNWISEKEAIDYYHQNPDCSILSNSENSISWIENNLSDSRITNQIEVFKNKIKFRELLQDHYPSYFFRAVKYDLLDDLKPSELKYPFIIKPARGFFSLGVYKVNTKNEWKSILVKIHSEINSYKDIYPREVIDVSDFIIEECIEGEEFAIDCYYNDQGEAVVLNVMQHYFSSQEDVSDRVYSTSKAIMKKYMNPIQTFLNLMGSKVNLKNFPIHVELRIDQYGKVNPIEVNPLRFGGWCTTADLSFFAHGFNSYIYFLRNIKPNWDTLLEEKDDQIYSLIALANDSKFKLSEILFFDYKKLLKDFENPLQLREFDFREHPTFGFLFIKTSSKNTIELDQILHSKIEKYIHLKK